MIHYAQFKTTDLQEVFNVVAEHPFALICKNGKEGVPEIVNAPVIISDDGKSLEFHFARANDAWDAIAAGGDVKIIFNGPNAHVSPSFYKDRFADGDRSKTAPTWDYVQAVVVGEAKPLDDAGLAAHLKKLTGHFEGEAGWRFEEIAPDKLDAWKKLIGGFRIEITSAEAIFKLSQEQKPADQAHVAHELNKRGRDGDAKIAKLICPKN